MEDLNGYQHGHVDELLSLLLDIYGARLQRNREPGMPQVTAILPLRSYKTPLRDIHRRTVECSLEYLLHATAISFVSHSS